MLLCVRQTTTRENRDTNESMSSGSIFDKYLMCKGRLVMYKLVLLDPEPGPEPEPELLAKPEEGCE